MTTSVEIKNLGPWDIEVRGVGVNDGLASPPRIVKPGETVVQYMWHDGLKYDIRERNPNSDG